MEDKKIICKTCGKEFIFTAGEQEFYKLREIKNEPKNCKACRDAKKAKFGGSKNRFGRN